MDAWELQVHDESISTVMGKVLNNHNWKICGEKVILAGIFGNSEKVLMAVNKTDMISCWMRMLNIERSLNGNDWNNNICANIKE